MRADTQVNVDGDKGYPIIRGNFVPLRVLCHTVHKPWIQRKYTIVRRLVFEPNSIRVLLN